MEINTFSNSGTKRFTAGFINMTRHCPYSLTLAMLETLFASFVNFVFSTLIVTPDLKTLMKYWFNDAIAAKITNKKI